MNKQTAPRSTTVLLLLAILLQVGGNASAARVHPYSPADPATPAATSVATYFPESGHNLALGFRDYWQAHGGIAAFGLPISEEFRQINAYDGREYTVQYFEQARFEYHPEISDPRYQVSLGFLGREAAQRDGINTASAPPAPATSYFNVTGHNLANAFLSYWQTNGGLDRFGYPISEEVKNAQGRVVQYFERAKFVYYPELTASDDEVQLEPVGYAALVAGGIDAPSGTLVQMLPPTLSEGSSMIVRTTAAAGAQISGSFNGQPIFWQRDDNPPYPGYWAIIGAPAMNGSGSHKLSFTISEPDGSRYNFYRNVTVYRRDFPVQDLPVNSSMAALQTPELLAKERAAMNAASDDSSNQQMWDDNFLIPLRQYRTTTTFGERRGYNGAPPSDYHTGIDMAAPEGTVVAAAARGRVVLATALPERGNCIVIDNGLGVHTVYAHLSQIGVRKGDIVQRGQFIGRVGSTGFSTGAHLHWEVRVGRTPVDPLEWVNRNFPLN